MRVGCLSPGQLEPQAGKQGELKRWKQFLIRGDPKRGKRSFKRAQRRADNNGHTVYRGRTIYGRSQGDSGTVCVSKPAPAIAPRAVSRSKIFCWNAGGLCGEAKVEFEHFLQISPHLDICLAQKTHWGSSGSWERHGWTYFHSAAEKSRQAGVLVAVRSSALDTSQTAWREIVPGRLLWLRANIRGQQWDLLCLYQVAQAGRDGETKEYRMKERRSIWNKLQRTLRGLPVRSLVVLGGDFNLSMEVLGPVTGSGVIAGSSDREAREERAKVLDMLRELQMTLLNTWAKPLPTYLHPTGNTQIDFLAVRRRNADKESKMAQPIDLGLTGWRGCGHRPLVASLRSVWKPWKCKVVRTGCRKEAVPPDGEEEIVQLRRRIKAVCVGPPRRMRMPELRAVGEHVERHWEARRRLQDMPQGDLSLANVFHLMRAACRAQRLHRNLKRECRQRRREQLLGCLAEAEEAHRRKDTRAFFGFVRAAAPKQYMPQIKLRGREGQLLTKIQEGKQLLDHVRDIFAGSTEGIPELVRVSEDIFSARNWELALGEVKARKAVPKGEAQMEAWKLDISENARSLSELSIRFLCSDKPWVPTLWCRIQIAWLPKPKKTPCCPSHLRTVGLMSGDSKSFMVLLKNAAHRVVQQSLQSFPQFAYRSGASTLDAILRVTAHCHRVRGILESTHHTKTARLLGSQVPSLRGGLMVAVDLMKAFDNVTYSEMYTALCETGLDEALVRLIAHVHLNTSCVVVHGDFEGSTGMSKGLRQGCPIAPLVYLAWSARFLRQVNCRLSERWDLEHATVYADDKHLCWEIEGVDSLHRAVKELGVVLQVLSDMGMAVSYHKCEAVLTLKGLKQTVAMKKYTKVRNGAPHLVIKAGSDVFIPLKSEIAYLGIMLSYGSFEYSTAQHRCRQAWISYKTLRNALRTNGVLSSAERLRIYKVCVWPVIEYGLCGTGLDARGLRLIRSTTAQQLRKVLRIHEHGVSNREVFDRARLDPHAVMASRLECQVERITQADGASILSGLRDRAAQVYDVFQRLVQTEGTALTPVCDSPGVPCPVCGLYFDSEAGVAIHIQRRHRELHDNSKVPFDRAKHCLDGIPKCVFCLSVLGDMQAMEKHIAAGGCLVMKQAIAAGEDLDSLRARLCSERTSASVTSSSLGACTALGTHCSDALAFLEQPPHLLVKEHAMNILAWSPCCMLCGQRMVDVKRVKTHWQAIHKTEWAEHASTARQLCQTLSKAVQRPCQFCQSGAKDFAAHATQCPMLFQAMLIHSIRTAVGSPAQQDELRPILPRRSEQVAKYKSFSLSETPLGAAFRKGLSQSSRPCATVTAAQVPSRGLSFGDEPSVGAPARQKQSQLGSFFRPAAESSRGAPGMEQFWTLRLRLRNPHSLCYLNAGVLSLMHFAEVMGLRAYASLVQVGREAQRRDRELCLSQQLMVRSLFPGWRFSDVQRDCAELLSLAVTQRANLWAAWVNRSCLRAVPETGACPILLPTPVETELTLQELVDRWSTDDGRRVLNTQQPLMLQLGRSTEQGKNQTSIRFEGTVRFPIARGNEVVHGAYKALAGVIHLGDRITSGHYRALLQHGSQWYLADDGVEAVITPMCEHITRNVYVLWLQPSDSA